MRRPLRFPLGLTLRAALARCAAASLPAYGKPLIPHKEIPKPCRFAVRLFFSRNIVENFTKLWYDIK